MMSILPFQDAELGKMVLVHDDPFVLLRSTCAIELKSLDRIGLTIIPLVFVRFRFLWHSIHMDLNKVIASCVVLAYFLLISLIILSRPP